MKMKIHSFTADTLSAAVAFSFALCKEKASASYPLFKTKEEMEKEFRWSLTHDAGALVGCYSGENLHGVLSCFQEPKEKYAQTTGFYVAVGDHDAAAALAAFLTEYGEGLGIHGGITKENATVAAALANEGYGLEEESRDLRRDMAPPVLSENSSQVKKVAEEDLPAYQAFHDAHFPGVYWNGERIAADFQVWDIYCVPLQGAIAGGLFLRSYENGIGEIFGLYAPDQQMAASLLQYAIEDLQKRSPTITQLIFMVEEKERWNLSAALSLGFTEESHYCCWVKDGKD